MKILAEVYSASEPPDDNEHGPACTAAALLWAKLQPGKEGEDVDKQTD